MAKNYRRVIISVIIPTYNRDKPLRDCLKTLFGQQFPGSEIVVVDQSSQHFTKKEIFYKRYKNRFRLFRLGKPNFTRALNLGIQKARGEILLFLDDDILADEKLLFGHLDNYKDNKLVGAVGRVLTEGQEEEPDYLGVGKVSIWGSVAGGYSSKIRQEVGNVVGCNVSFRKTNLVEVGGFDENFVGNALRNETDLALRIKKRERKLIFDPEALVIHNRALTGGCRKDENRLGWYHDYFHNETYFFLKHFPAWRWPIFWLLRWQWFVKAMFGRGVSWRSLVTPWKGIYDGVKTFWGWQNENRS